MIGDYDALYRRYMNEANYYAGLYGLDSSTSSKDGHWDAFRHAYASAVKRGDLIINLDQDGRYYTGPTLVPSPYDYDRNRIDQRPNPSLPGAVGGQIDIQAPEDRPLSQDEIDQIRRTNGIPKGGLF